MSTAAPDDERLLSLGETLLDRVAIVTGAASGIGQATVVELGRRGAHVVAVDLNRQGLANLALTSGIGPEHFRAQPADLADPTQLLAALEAALSWHGRIDILVNCAGITGELGPFTELSLTGWERTQAVNLRAPMLAMQFAGRHMSERGSGGRIVNLSSSAAFRHGAGASAYVASKGGISALTRVVAEEFGPYDINVNAVAPGLTRTGMTAFYGDDEAFRTLASEGPNANFFQRPAEPEDVAAVIAFLCLPASRQITGQTLHTSAGAS